MWSLVRVFAQFVSALALVAAYPVIAGADPSPSAPPTPINSTPATIKPYTPIDQKADAFGGTARLGQPMGREVCGLRGGGCLRRYQLGTIYWSARTGAQVSTSGPLLSRYEQLGAQDSRLGYPIADTHCGGGPCYQDFEGGAIVWTGYGALTSWGAIRGEWAVLGFERGRLGLPTTDEVCGLRGGGCYQNFEGGAILWSPATGAHFNVGAIRGRYAASGFENGLLGYPVTGERCGLRDGGCYQRFAGGSIYWSPRTPTVAVRGRMLETWGRAGWEWGRYGYPVAQEEALHNGAITQRFQHGEITVGR